MITGRLYLSVCLSVTSSHSRLREAEMKKIRHAMKNYTQMEGTAEAEKWAEEAHISKKTEVRNFRSDISDEDKISEPGRCGNWNWAITMTIFTVSMNLAAVLVSPLVRVSSPAFVAGLATTLQIGGLLIAT